MTGARQDSLRFNLLVKPTGAACNLDCRYCFYLEKAALYPDSRFRMSDDVLETYVRQLLAAHPAGDVTIAWQGGEPTLMGLDFFRRAVAYADAHARPGQRIIHTIQTNGTRLDDTWCTFLKEHNFLVGLSIDGPRAMHDAYRVNRGGKGTFAPVLRAWNRLQRHRVDTNVLCTVHAANAAHPLQVYRFFRDSLQARFLQFIPIVEPIGNGPAVTERSVSAREYGRFLTTLFDEWVQRDVGTVYVQLFDVTLGNYVGQPSLCVFAPTCGDALALEHNGDLYACDHYVTPDHRLGNIAETPLPELVTLPQQRAFGRAKRDTLPQVCRTCDVRFACHGGCPKNRFLPAPGEANRERFLNYLCEAYQHFFRHVDRPMRIMAELLRRKQSPAGVMTLLAAGNSFP